MTLARLPRPAALAVLVALVASLFTSLGAAPAQAINPDEQLRRDVKTCAHAPATRLRAAALPVREVTSTGAKVAADGAPKGLSVKVRLKQVRPQLWCLQMVAKAPKGWSAYGRGRVVDYTVGSLVLEADRGYSMWVPVRTDADVIAARGWMTFRKDAGKYGRVAVTFGSERSLTVHP